MTYIQKDYHRIESFLRCWVLYASYNFGNTFFYKSYKNIYNTKEKLKIILSIVRIPLITFNSSNEFHYQNNKTLSLFLNLFIIII
jgi:hypothetical protein